MTGCGNCQFECVGPSVALSIIERFGRDDERCKCRDPMGGPWLICEVAGAGASIFVVYWSNCGWLVWYFAMGNVGGWDAGGSIFFRCFSPSVLFRCDQRLCKLELSRVNIGTRVHYQPSVGPRLGNDIVAVPTYYANSKPRPGGMIGS